ncbi:hypothetical protein ACR76B_22795 [Phocaeicola vulgatus]|uniref:hypothetical protein n=1 Tax=Phocaeicola vulgatus TaxID=821 RepID=UPI003DA2DE36
MADTKPIAPERIIDNKLYEQLQALQQVKNECIILFSKFSHQGMEVPRTDEATLYQNLDCCMRILAILAGCKYEFDLQKGGTL